LFFRAFSFQPRLEDAAIKAKVTSLSRRRAEPVFRFRP
jgi:hypothetical protein